MKEIALNSQEKMLCSMGLFSGGIMLITELLILVALAFYMARLLF